MALVFKKIGWGYLGNSWPLGWQGSWPFATLEVYDDKIIFKLLPFKKEVQLSDIEYVKKGHFIPVTSGIRIYHHAKGSNNIQFGSSDLASVVDGFRKINVDIRS